MDAEILREMVRVVGFSFGNTTAAAVSQAINFVESFSAQNSRSAVSSLKVGSSFNFFGINSFLTFCHNAGGNYPQQFVSDGKSNKKPAVCIGSPQREKSCFAVKMFLIKSNYQRQIEKDILTFAIGNLWKMPVFIGITFVPGKTFTIY